MVQRECAGARLAVSLDELHAEHTSSRTHLIPTREGEERWSREVGVAEHLVKRDSITVE